MKAGLAGALGCRLDEDLSARSRPWALVWAGQIGSGWSLSLLTRGFLLLPSGTPQGRPASPTPADGRVRGLVLAAESRAP